MSRPKHHAKDGFRQRLALLASQNAAYFAAVGFVILQVSLGIVMKASQNEKGQYGFSASGCVTISEFFKFGLSSLLFWVEVRRRRRSGGLGGRAGIRGEEGFGVLPTSERSSVELSDLSSEEEDLVAEDEKEDEEEEVGMLSGSREGGERNVEGWFWGVWTREIGVEKRVGFAQLALLYALINNTIFVAYKLADPGTISLTRSGVTFITALVMICALGTRITKVQWTAIVLQVFGLIISQYHAKTGMSYPLTTYGVLLFQVFLSAVSGVYNQALLKSGNASLHASNMMLYLCGVVFNLAIHLCTRLLNPSEPGFLVGYGKVGAVLVVVSNVFMGIAISAVFKYADAVIKCLATAVSTGILLYLSPILFGVPMNPLIVPGAAVVLISSWLYMETAMSNEQQQQQQKEEIGWARSYSQNFIDELSTWVSEHRRLVLGFGALLTITIASFLGSAKASMPDLKPKTAPSSTDPSDSTLESPFKNTLAFIRIDNGSPPPLQTELVQNYASFFHTLHISRASNENSENLETDTAGKGNLTHDSWQGNDFVYKQVASTMQLLLNSPVYSEGWGVEGLFFLSSTSWIDPLDLSFTPLLQENVLLPSPLTCTTTPPSSTSPEYLALQASYILSLTEFPYNIKEGEYCIGLNNFYYVPRRFFEEFIFLSKVFGGIGGKGGAEEAWAVSTIFRILDRSRRDVGFRSILTQIGGCWHGDEVYGDVVDEFTCGSGLRFEGGDVEGVQRQNRRLERQASVLGRGIEGLKASNWTKEERGGNLRVYFDSLGWDDVDQKEEVEELVEALGEIAIGNGTKPSL